jgi:hypothetical protein
MPRGRAARQKQRVDHIHLPSVHIRSGGDGFDYDEDLYVRGREVTREVKLVIWSAGVAALERLTVDHLCDEEIAGLDESLGSLLVEGDPEAEACMEERARNEYARQLRILAGQEQVCFVCGCSESRACSGGCIWATARLCSRCL